MALAAGKSPAIRRGQPNKGLTPYLYLAPALLVLLLFVYYPLLSTFYISFHEWNLVSTKRTWVGLENYHTLLTNPDFGRLLVQSGMYVLLALLGNFLLPVGLALLTLQVREREGEVYQSLLFAPTVVAVSVGSLVWLWFYLPAGGVFNGLLSHLGLPPQTWLSNAATALPAVSLVAVWKFLGFHYLIALAGLRAIPRDLLEAARVDGAYGVVLLLRVVLPLFGPSALFLFLSTVIQALEYAFIPIEVLTVGGPFGSTSNLMYAVYQDGFKFFRAGLASAQAVLMMALFAGFILWQFRLLEQGVRYER
ncbi:MAG: sugar ABC transporter permease [Thermaceae bacterium]|nr:sugar ABC transporter permease [Thermaceae bacterium]